MLAATLRCALPAQSQATHRHRVESAVCLGMNLRKGDPLDIIQVWIYVHPAEGHSLQEPHRFTSHFKVVPQLKFTALASLELRQRMRLLRGFCACSVFFLLLLLFLHVAIHEILALLSRVSFYA